MVNISGFSISAITSLKIAALNGHCPPTFTAIPARADMTGIVQACSAPVSRTWFGGRCPGGMLTVGELKPRKDYLAQLLAFALVQNVRAVHLLILGGSHRVVMPKFHLLIRKA